MDKLSLISFIDWTYLLHILLGELIKESTKGGWFVSNARSPYIC
jgi:hypothetical protein